MKLLLLTLTLITTLFSAELDWPSDYEKALAEAKKENKNIYLLITSVNCRWCRKFEATTLKDENTISRLKKSYVLLHMDRDFDDIPEKFEKKRVPRHYFLTNEGETIHSFLGYWNEEDFSSFLNDVDKKTKEK